MVKQETTKKNIDSIRKDIPRTFPNHIYYNEGLGGKGQEALFNVLKALSLYTTESGYVQGMGYISAILLMYMNEEDSFWAMASLLDKYNHK